MTEKERVIKPPLEELTTGRVFRPANAFLFKKVLKVSLLLLLIWALVVTLLFTHPALTFILNELFEPTELIVGIGFYTFTQYYIMGSLAILVFGSLYIYLYFKRVEYSVIGRSGEAMPEVYCKKGIINITKKHVPFRTISFIRMRRGVFDRLLGIGTVVIETASSSPSPHPGGGLLAFLIQGLNSSKAEEHIEGIRFFEELRDFILRELRGLGAGPRLKTQTRVISNPLVLVLFKEIKDALKER
ncbi:MAG: PH domain-containing protein [Promethearchaeota archaeon]